MGKREQFNLIVCVLEGVNMGMTEQEFNEWIETEDGDSSFYEYLYDAYPSSSDDGIIDMMESGLYVEEFMDYLGVIYDETE